VLTVKEEQFAAQLYALMSDTSVHPLVAEREYARLMRNISIEYGLLLLTKLDKLGLNIRCGRAFNPHLRRVGYFPGGYNADPVICLRG
jgi:hypothetical protein